MNYEKPYDFVVDICKQYGARIAGSESDLKTADEIKQILSEITDEVREEDFQVCPRSLQIMINFIIGIFTIGVISYFLTFLADFNILQLDPLLYTISILISLFTTFLSILTFLLFRLKRIYISDIFCKKKRTKTVYGIIKPKGEVKHRVIISAHHDSAYEMPLFFKYKRYMGIIQNVGVLGIIILFIESLLKLFNIESLIPEPIHTIVLLIFVVLIIVGFINGMMMKFGLVTNRPVIGASDNLSSVAAILWAGKEIHENPLQSTEVWVVSFGAEEPGLIGSKFFVTKHYDEIKDVLVINLETVGTGEHAVIAKETANAITHSKEVVDLLVKSAKDIGKEISSVAISFGDTDATSFTMRDIKAATLFCKDVDGLFPLWHSPDDNPDNIDNEHIEIAKQIVVQSLRNIDKD